MLFLSRQLTDLPYSLLKRSLLMWLLDVIIKDLDDYRQA